MRTPSILHFSPQSKAANAVCMEKGCSVREQLIRRLSPDGNVHVESFFEEDILPVLEDVHRRYNALIVTGSSYGVHDAVAHLDVVRSYVKEAIARDMPVLGICFGHQLLAQQHGATVEVGDRGKEKGVVRMRLTPEGKADALFQDVPEEFSIGTYHGDVVTKLPETGASILATNDTYAIQSLSWGERVRTVQFHPEFTAHTAHQISNGKVPVGDDVEGIENVGNRILRNFIKHFLR